MVAVNSSWIEDASHENGTLTLVMNGNSYDWPDPDGALYQGITTAPSAGSYYNQHLRNRSSVPSLGTAARAVGRLVVHGAIARGLRV